MPIPLAVVFAATAVSAWGKYAAGEAEADAFSNSAFAKRKAAKDVMKRFDINAEFTRLEGESFKGKQLSAFASSGVAIGSGMTLSAIEDTAKKIERQILIDEMEAESHRDNLLLQADLDEDRAGAASAGGKLGAVASVASAFIR